VIIIIGLFKVIEWPKFLISKSVGFFFSFAMQLPRKQFVKNTRKCWDSPQELSSFVEEVHWQERWDSPYNFAIFKVRPVAKPVWAQFHQRSTYSFYLCRSQKHKKILTTWLSSYALGSYGRKAARKYVDEIDTRAQFHQRSTYSFYARRSQKRKKTLMT